MARELTITDAAYERLMAHQRAGESVSDVILRLTQVQTGPHTAAGTAPGLGAAVEAGPRNLEDELD